MANQPQTPGEILRAATARAAQVRAASVEAGRIARAERDAAERLAEVSGDNPR